MVEDLIIMSNNIALYNLEPKIVNTAMMQVSQYHKEKGDNVYDYHMYYHNDYDKIYAFSIFDFTDKRFVTDDMICGGTGFDYTTKLPKEIEKCNYDYSLYPNLNYSIVWFSRGCVNNCPFCVVPQKEGYIHSVEPKALNPNGKYIKVMDNNFFANPKWEDAVETLLDWNRRIDLQGFDIRMLNEYQAQCLSLFKMWKPFKFGWDNPKDNIDDKIELLLDYVNPSKITCYILIGYWSTEQEDLYRVEHIRNYGINTYVMPYDKSDKYQLDFSRYVNNKKIFASRSWEDYKNGNKR